MISRAGHDLGWATDVFGIPFRLSRDLRIFRSDGLRRGGLWTGAEVVKGLAAGGVEPQDEASTLAWVRQFYRDIFADTGGVFLPVSLAVCQTNPATGACLAAPDNSVTTQINARATPTFAVFMTGQGPVAFDPAAPGTLWAGTHEGGVYRSTDGGARWQAASGTAIAEPVHALAVLPSDPRTIFAGTLNGGLYRSTDRGATWQFNSQKDGQVYGVSVR